MQIRVRVVMASPKPKGDQSDMPLHVDFHVEASLSNSPSEDLDSPSPSPSQPDSKLEESEEDHREETRPLLDSSNESSPSHETDPEPRSKWRNHLKIGGLCLTGAVAVPVAVTLAVPALGFGAAGIAAGSWAAGFMGGYGGAVGAGSLCAFLQSAGAVGLSTGAVVGLGAGGAAAGGVAAAAAVGRKG
ncbi:hypothetical protein HKX48_001047 [Thoreauomyces humboldtii]|nr:hypothetical protein HKX48_001047 [Thoreauomyces humboldtii]